MEIENIDCISKENAELLLNLLKLQQDHVSIKNQVVGEYWEVENYELEQLTLGKIIREIEKISICPVDPKAKYYLNR